MKISIEGVSKKYDKVVLKNINIQIENCSSVAIIGKSGCGKSTLLKIMTAIEPMEDGNIYFDGVSIKENTREFQNQIGVVFQQHNLFPHLSILENITLILEKRKGYKPVEAINKANKIINDLKLENEMNKKPKYVSGGQAQRASIARAVATDPKIIFMDEPTASLDPILTKEVLETIKILKENGTKFIFVTHEMEFVSKFAEYVIFMDNGEIIEHGANIFKKPKSKLLKQFLNYGGIN